MMPKMMKCFTVLSLFLLITGANMLVFRDSRQDSRVMKEKVRIILNKNHGSSNEIAAAEIKKELVNNFPWKDAAIGVYNPCSGFDCHTVGGSNHHGFREHGKNWFVIWQDKDEPKANVKRSDIKNQVSALASNKLTHVRGEEAKTVYYTLMQQLRPKPKSLAVVQHGNGLRGYCTYPFHCITQAFTFSGRDTGSVNYNDPSLSSSGGGSYAVTKTFSIMIGF